MDSKSKIVKSNKCFGVSINLDSDIWKGVGRDLSYSKADRIYKGLVKSLKDSEPTISLRKGVGVYLHRKGRMVPEYSEHCIVKRKIISINKFPMFDNDDDGEDCGCDDND